MSGSVGMCTSGVKSLDLWLSVVEDGLGCVILWMGALVCELVWLGAIGCVLVWSVGVCTREVGDD